MLPNEDVSPDLREFMDSNKSRCRNIEYSIGFNELKNVLDKYLKCNNFSQMEITSIYHLMNSFYFFGFDLNKNIYVYQESLNNYLKEDGN
jgi:hypothetical protein